LNEVGDDGAGVVLKWPRVVWITEAPWKESRMKGSHSVGGAARVVKETL